MDLKLKAGETFLCIGDSITDCSRRDVAAPLGNGYVKMFSDMILASAAEKKIKVVNKGIGGNACFELKMRWDDNVIYHKPDRLSILIGINDCHRFMGGEQACSLKAFEKDYNEILARTKEKIGCPVILMEPFFISKDSSDNYRKNVLKLLPEYIKIVHSVSKEFKTGLIGLHDIFAQQLKYNDADTFCPEPVHPNLTGHLVIAQNLFNAITK